MAFLRNKTKSMILAELLSGVRSLSTPEKIKLIHLLAEELDTRRKFYH